MHVTSQSATTLITFACSNYSAHTTSNDEKDREMEGGGYDGGAS